MGASDIFGGSETAVTDISSIPGVEGRECRLRAGEVEVNGGGGELHRAARNPANPATAKVMTRVVDIFYSIKRGLLLINGERHIGNVDYFGVVY